MRVRITAIAALLATALAGCEPLEPVSDPTPSTPAGKTPAPPPAPPSARSDRLREYYAGVQTSLLSQGLLRGDGGGDDTPFTRRQLVDNFIQIGVFNEYTLVEGQYRNSRSEGRVRRWTEPVALDLDFGRNVEAGQKREDRATVAAYANRLTGLTGLPITLEQEPGNFHVAVLDVDEIAAYGPKLERLVPGLTADIARQITLMPRETYCAVYTFSDAETPDRLDTAIAIIRSEHPDRLRKNCFHEEIAQGLGLSNDSPAARPSIFNDTDEFALLTRHDELLLKILYDGRLPIGATPAQARPIVETIAAELLGGRS